MPTAAKEEKFSAPMVWTEECVLPLAASGVYPKTRVWGSRKKTLPCFSATAPLSVELHRGCENSSGKTAAGSGLDANGNTLTKTDSTGITAYTWDFENRLTSVILPGSGGTVTFKYDPFGRRIYKSSSVGTSIFAYDGANLIEETNTLGVVVARYTQGLHIDEPLVMLRNSATSFYHADGLGSVTSLSDAAGALVQTYTFDSFGKQTASTGSLTNPFQYTAREFDPESGMYEYRARYYDPNVGRFVREDPVKFWAGSNFYSYVHNNPATYFDPFGLQEKKPWWDWSGWEHVPGVHWTKCHIWGWFCTIPALDQRLDQLKNPNTDPTFNPTNDELTNPKDPGKRQIESCSANNDNCKRFLNECGDVVLAPVGDGMFPK
ncbi:MAG: RHS repeat-associated core domain-containing protein [Candidatus Acidiferrum sp.]